MHIYNVSKTIFYGDIKLPIDVYDSICSMSENKILKNKNCRQLNCQRWYFKSQLRQEY